jgi:hypothetical protein
MNAPLQAPRVIIGAAPQSRQRLRAILPGWDLRFVDTAAQLLGELADGRCDMLIVGVHFQQSTAIAAIERVLARDETIPVVCIRCRPFSTPLGQPTLDALRMASQALGARNFIDLLEYPDDEVGNACVRAMLERLVYVT